MCVSVSGAEIEREFLPWLTDSASDALHQQVVVRQILDDVIRYVMTTRRTLMDELEAQFLMIQSGADDDHLVRVTVVQTMTRDYSSTPTSGGSEELGEPPIPFPLPSPCLLYTSDAADE